MACAADHEDDCEGEISEQIVEAIYKRAKARLAW